MNRKNQGRLIELSKSDFEVVKGDADIRGWKVKDLYGKRIGKVDELILDTVNRKVRYMVVDLGKNEFDLDDKKVLIPIGLAELHRDHDDVLLPGLQVNNLNNIPEYDRDHMDGNYERKICYALGMEKDKSHVDNMDPEPEFYKHDYYNDDNLYRHRLREESKNTKDSEFEKGLRLWEKRAEGGIIPDTTSSVDEHERRERNITGDRMVKKQNKDELQPVKRERKPIASPPKNRRDQASGRPNIRPGKSIEDRIRNEGLQE